MSGLSLLPNLFSKQVCLLGKPQISCMIFISIPLCQKFDESVDRRNQVKSIDYFL